MRTINLMPRYRLAAKRQWRNLRRWAIACTVYAVVLTVLSILCQTIWSSAERSYAEQLAQAAERIEQTNEAIAEIGPQLAHTRMMLAIEKEIVSQPDWSILLAMLGQIMGPDIVLRECELNPIRPAGHTGPAGITLLTGDDGSIRLGAYQYELKLRGLGRSQSEVSQYVLRLEETELFEQVKLINTMREPIGNMEAFAFHIECVLGTAPVESAEAQP